MADRPGEDFIYEDQSQIPEILPIFPLPNVVLIPNASVPLFIFEERYKQMVRDCLETDRYLSIALLKKGWEQESGPPRPYPVAGFGRIVRAVRLPNECMDIVVQGMGRITMTAFHDDQAYLRASVEMLHPVYPAGQDLSASAETLRRRFLTLLDTRGVSALELRTHLKLLASPIDLVFFIMSHLPLDLYIKQEILEKRTVDEQIFQLLDILSTSLGTQLN
jgi:Lon protease-like protein